MVLNNQLKKKKKLDFRKEPLNVKSIVIKYTVSGNISTVVVNRAVRGLPELIPVLTICILSL